jgi:hypothetical protein
LDVNDVVSLDSPSSEFNAYMSILVAIQVIYRALTRRLTTKVDRFR